MHHPQPYTTGAGVGVAEVAEIGAGAEAKTEEEADPKAVTGAGTGSGAGARDGTGVILEHFWNPLNLIFFYHFLIYLLKKGLKYFHLKFKVFNFCVSIQNIIVIM